MATELEKIREWLREIDEEDPHGEMSYLVPAFLALVDEVERLGRRRRALPEIPDRGITLDDLRRAIFERHNPGEVW